jgi:hypothetical protein
MSPELGALVFLVGMIALGVVLLGGIYLLLLHDPMPEQKTAKKIVMSNVR